MAELPKLNTIVTAMDSNKVLTGIAAAAIIGGVAAGAVAIAHRKKSRKRKTSSNKNSRKKLRRGKRRKLKFGSPAYRRKYLKHGRRTPHTAGKRRDTSRRRIRYTTKGQPYVIGAHGKARFISKKSAHSSYKREGGKY